METKTLETPSLEIPFPGKDKGEGMYHSNPFINVGPIRPSSLQLNFKKDKNDNNIRHYSIPDLYESCDDLNSSVFTMDTVTLPERYRKLIKKNRQESIPEEEEYTGPSISCDSDICDTDNSDKTKSFDRDFKSDMDQAILWIRQEITQLKARDRSLIRKFLGLRATLHQLRGIRSCPTLARSIASMNNVSWSSLDEGALSEPCMVPLTEKEMLMGFQNRTVSMLSVVDTMPEPKKTPLKPRTSLDILYLPP